MALAETLTFLISLILGRVDDLNSAIIKLGLFVLLLALFSKGVKKAFPEDTKIANVIAVVVALMSVRLMPSIWLPAIGKFLWVLLVILVPYLIVDKMLKKWSLIKAGFLSAIYFGVYLLVSEESYWSFKIFKYLVRDLLDYWYYYNWQIIIVIVLVIVYSILRIAKRRKS